MSAGWRRPPRTSTAAWPVGSEAVLVADHIAKSYPTARGDLQILTNVSLSLERGAAIAIMGPSGSGKSTLLYILGVLEPPTAGAVTLDGQNPFGLNEREQAAFRNRHIGFVFQDHSLLPQCSVLENVLAPTLVAPPEARAPRADAVRARSLLEQVGLADRLDHRPAELSGGEKQRAALARALIRNPSLLLCDEPTGNLDRASADSVADLLLALHASRQTMLVVVTHSTALAGKFPVRYEMIGGALTRQQAV
jgi:lipoprotein-releasing system ATP-binding protein